MVQQIIAYLILFAALTYLAHRFVYPIPLFTSKRKGKKDCGSSDCGCS